MNRFFINRYHSPYSQILVCSPRCTRYKWVSSGRAALSHRDLDEDIHSSYPRTLASINQYLEIPSESVEAISSIVRGDHATGHDYMSLPEIAAVVYNPPRGQDAGPIQIPKTIHKIGVPKNKLP